jgi:hypothetical protein
MKGQIKFLRLKFYGPWATPCQQSTPTPNILLVISLLEVLRFGLRVGNEKTSPKSEKNQPKKVKKTHLKTNLQVYFLI